MIPILYSPTDDLATLGRGALSDCISCIVTEEINGKYVLELTYPVNGARYADLREGAIISAVPSKGRVRDYFTIVSITKPLSGIVEVYAEHVSYRTSLIPVMPFSAGSCVAAIAGLKTNSAESNPFTFWTDIQSSESYTQQIPASLRGQMLGSDGSIVQIYGGEFEFDRYDIKLHSARGTDSGVELRYGKNITDLNQETNIANTITGICPFWASSDRSKVITLPEKVVSSSAAANFPFNRTVVHDFSSQFKTEPTEAQLRAAAQDYVLQAGIGVPEVSCEVKFIDLSGSADYSGIALLESVKLCDTVTVIFEPYGINSKAKVVRAKWNVLKDRYDSVVLGAVRSSIAGIITGTERETAEAVKDTRSILAEEIASATEQITGVDGGYIRYVFDANGDPMEFLILNTPDISTATRVWRWNQNGLGVSNDGYAGPYEMAMTADGHFVASFITAGTLNANLIKAGLLQDVAGKFSLDMSTGSAQLANASITGGSIYIDTATIDSDLIRLNFGNSYAALMPARLIVNNDGIGFRTQYEGGGILIIKDGKLISTVALSVGTYGPYMTFRDPDGQNVLAEIYCLQGGGALALHDSAGTTRAYLTQNGLTFYDASGNVTRTYSAT